MKTHAAFTSAVTSSDLPAHVRCAASNAQAVEEHCFDDSYLEFLDQQIELNASGDAWTERLRARRANLSEYCNHTLIRGRIVVDGVDWSLEVEPETRRVVHCETYQLENHYGENAT